MKFNYKARTPQGELKSGYVEASSSDAALSVLQKNGLIVSFLSEQELVPFYTRKLRTVERVSQKDIVLFARQLALMFKSKVPLIEALRTLSYQMTNELLKEKILSITKEVEGGSPLSQAMSMHSKVFSAFAISMVKAGEASGKLSESLNYLADSLEKSYDFSSKIKSALSYPILVVCVVILVLCLVIFLIIPQMTGVLTESGAELPAITKVVMALPGFLKTWGTLFLIALIGIIVYSMRYYKTEEGKMFFDRLALKIPIIGYFLRLTYIARFSENLATLITAGLPIAQSLDISGNIVGNALYEKLILDARDGVRKGETISSVLMQDPVQFPSSVTEMLLVGEKTGTLDEVLFEVSSFYTKEVDRQTQGLLKLIEPILIIFLGGVVGLLIGSVLLPMYQMVGT